MGWDSVSFLLFLKNCFHFVSYFGFFFCFMLVNHWSALRIDKLFHISWKIMTSDYEFLGRREENMILLGSDRGHIQVKKKKFVWLRSNTERNKHFVPPKIKKEIESKKKKKIWIELDTWDKFDIYKLHIYIWFWKKKMFLFFFFLRRIYLLIFFK